MVTLRYASAPFRLRTTPKAFLSRSQRESKSRIEALGASQQHLLLEHPATPRLGIRSFPCFAAACRRAALAFAFTRLVPWMARGASSKLRRRKRESTTPTHRSRPLCRPGSKSSYRREAFVRCARSNLGKFPDSNDRHAFAGLEEGVVLVCATHTSSDD